ncbi:uncharacterized protein GGS25DRAFT_159568 [Hypoxylon fragiforme]|uniref:uncharacterized protein n=1 Tax=Hypoxylon fragiforme TaxID=63214 RepID=UPI0020C5FD48|nr:uncharacterized protein GGS25DRAFT_159568 [Hypoxylon fragiforme]KAI2610688.1 hypothetical protein GGS25DRAFT_159568 [Hypoxylon fragiforme]
MRCKQYAYVRIPVIIDLNSATLKFCDLRFSHFVTRFESLVRYSYYIPHLVIVVPFHVLVFLMLLAKSFLRLFALQKIISDKIYGKFSTMVSHNYEHRDGLSVGRYSLPSSQHHGQPMQRPSRQWVSTRQSLFVLFITLTCFTPFSSFLTLGAERESTVK